MAFIFPSQSQTSPRPKLNVISGILPPQINPKKPPYEESPWRQVNDIPFIYSTTVVLPESLHELVWREIESQIGKPRYMKVILKLQDILNEEILHGYIKNGRLCMISEGEPGVNNTYSLHSGILRLNLNREKYEKSGLQGKPIVSGGRKHSKSQHLIEIDLRQPSMQHGKKGFEKLVWAAQNVLKESVLWLFCELGNTVDTKPNTSPSDTTNLFSTHHPTTITITPEIHTLTSVTVPMIISSNLDNREREDQEVFYDISEWLDLAALSSPRIQSTHQPDPVISRYTPPDINPVDTSTKSNNLKIVRFTGLPNADWVSNLLGMIIQNSRSSKRKDTLDSNTWAAMSLSTHRTCFSANSNRRPIDGCTILLQYRTDSASPAPKDKDLNAMNIDASSENTSGLQRFVYFEHIDSID